MFSSPILERFEYDWPLYYLRRMIKNWLKAPELSRCDPDQLPAYAFGRRLKIHRFAQRDLRKVKVAIVGVDASFAEKTRNVLYRLSWNFGKLEVADLGDLRKVDPDFIIPLLRELQASDIIPLLIGTDRSVFRAQYQAFQELKREVSVAVVDQEIRLSTEPSKAKAYVLNGAVHAPRKRIYHLCHLGAQQHLVDPAVFQLLNQAHFDYVRLGAAREDIQQLEPLVRDADLMGLDIASIKLFEAPAQSEHHPGGFDLEEATRLCRYAGISDKLQSFGLFGVDSKASDRDLDVTSAAYAQLIWYFLDGFAARKGDFPVSAKGLTEYVVDLKDYDRITFWKSPRSGRWWIQAPAGKHNGEDRHRLIPCSYQDYQQACRQEIPERLLQAFRRYE